ncbi:protein kinase domain-containing protein [Dokdonella sp. MW10]|uniref:protein kinase domain-containing protein n=1 Tax=Dokdonella sp. MW10 TaxID=2992926 RepID=UPI003F7FB8C2
MTTMDPARLRALFDAAVDLDAAARRVHLDAHCPPELRAELEAMLAADAETHDGPSPARIDRLADFLSDTHMPTPAAGTRIGPFEIVGPLGEGGFAMVLHARRDIGGARQEVALKLLRRSLHSPEAQRQFRREQQALLALQHPNIARLIEGGVTNAGQPYLALELVHGSDIVEHAKARALDLRARLRLFVVTCRAVDAAHRALIVHRDLKPSNVFVADDGEVKLLDFGIAKLLEADEDVTRTLLPAFTTAYAAPEQRRNGVITTATDVYALGVVLGELLTGERVNDGSGRTPSSRVSATGGDGSPTPVTRRQLRGDLDTIVMKALADEPERRYASAGAFSDDVDRLLAGQPVVAHPPSRWYRTRKFVTRHKGGVATTAAFLLAILASLGLALWQARVAREEAQRANQQTQRAEAVRDFMVGLFDAAQPEVPREKRPGIEEIVDEASDRMLADARLPPATRLDLLLALARVTQSLGSAPRTHALLDRAQADVDTLKLPADSDPARRLGVLRAEAWLAESNPAAVRERLGASRTAIASHGDMLAVATLSALASAEAGDNDIEAARRTYADARNIAATLGEDAVRGVDIAEAESLALSQRFGEALALANTTRERWTAAGAPPDRGMIGLLLTTANASSATGNVEQADAAYREAIALAERVYARPHPETAWAVGVYGSFLVSKAHYGEAEPYIERALAMRRSLLGETHPDTLNAFAALGRLRAGQRRHAEARRAFEEGIANCETGGVRHPVCPRLLGSLSQILMDAGEVEQAQAFATRAVEEQEKLSGDDGPQLVSPLQFLARVEIRRDRHDDVLRTTDRILAIAAKNGSLASKDVRSARFYRATALDAVGRHDEALALILEVVAEQRAKTPDEKTTLFSMLALQARALARAGRIDEAKAAADEALAIDPRPSGVAPATLVELQRLAGRVGDG